MREAVIDDPSRDCESMVFQHACVIRFAEKGVYYTVIHKYDYQFDLGWRVPVEERAARILDEQKKATQQFLRSVEVSKMMYQVDENLTDNEGNPIHMPDPDQTPEYERLKKLYLHVPESA